VAVGSRLSSVRVIECIDTFVLRISSDPGISFAQFSNLPQVRRCAWIRPVATDEHLSAKSSDITMPPCGRGVSEGSPYWDGMATIRSTYA
jgi:hypothetical protein